MSLKPNCTLLYFAGFLVFLLSNTIFGRTVLASHHMPQIAFVFTRDGNPEIYVMDADGNNQIRLTNHPTWDIQPSWSPDGGRIAFVSDRNGGNCQIYVMDSNGKNVRRLTAGISDGQPAWSPDGEKIAFAGIGDEEIGRENRKAKIYIVNPDGTNLQTLSGDVPSYDSEPAWSPDGQRMAFVSSRENWGYEIYLMDADGTNQKRLTHHMVSDRAPAWSPDGGTIAYVSGIQGRNNAAIHLMTADGEHLKRLSKWQDGEDYQPDWFAPAALTVSPASNQLTIWGKLKKLASSLR